MSDQAVPEKVRSARSRLLRRLVPLALIALAAGYFLREMPRGVELVYRLPAQRQGLRALEIDLLKPDGALIRHAEFLYSPTNPAPEMQRHPLKLPPGQVEVRATLVWPDRREAITRSITFERQDEIEIPLT